VDFLLRDWTPTALPERSDVRCWLRDDLTLIAFEVRGASRIVSVVDADGKLAGTAEIRQRASDGATILVPVSRDPDDIADALHYWPKHPSIHIAATELAQRVLWPVPKETP
jgi:hypothetical protein